MDVAQVLIAIVGLGASVTTYCFMRFPHMCREASGSMQPAQSSFPVLHRLWGQQASPGLYTWDTVLSVKDEVADGWQYARGWHNELAVTPDYETAALLLLLQQDMLEYLDDQAAEPTVVIGAGLTGAWLSQPMAVSNLALPGGSITWQWDGHAMRVTLRGPSREVRLGAAFPAGTSLTVTHKPATR